MPSSCCSSASSRPSASLVVAVPGGAFLARPAVRDALDRLTSRAGPSLPAWLEELDALSASLQAGRLDDGEERPRGAPGNDDPLGAGAIDELPELARLGLEYLHNDPNPSASGLVSWLEASLRSDPAYQVGDAVDLVTFHRAKGLEWPVVFVTGLEDGLVPIAHAHSADAARRGTKAPLRRVHAGDGRPPLLVGAGALLRGPPFGPDAFALSCGNRGHPSRPRPPGRGDT